MGTALQLVSGRVSPAAASTMTACEPLTGDSFTVRSTSDIHAGDIHQMWATIKTINGTVRIRSPRLHDNVQGIRQNVIFGEPQPLLGGSTIQPVYSQDALTWELAGEKSVEQCMSAQIYYPNLDGVAAALSSWSSVEQRIVNLLGVETDLTSSAAECQYGGEQALNASFDNFKRNVYYAILGYTVTHFTHAVYIYGSDTGNLRVGGPGVIRNDITANWFADQSALYGLPYIPIINAANVAATTVGCVSGEASKALVVTWNMAELSHGGV